MAKNGLIKKGNIEVTPREIDFVTRFGLTWEALQNILGIMRPIKKQPGAVLKSKKATVVLAQSVGEGEEIPYSEANIVEIPYAEMDVEKYSKAVSIEAIKEHGYDVAVGMTDDAFLNELQGNVMGRFYDYLNTGALSNIQGTYQMCMAMAKGLVVNKFKKMHKSCTEVVAFVNVLDVYEYLGATNITVQNQFGFQYIKDFMGYNTVFLLSDDEVARGTVLATPVENIVLYYVDPSDSDFAKADLVYVTDGVTNLIGFHTQGNYGTAVSESFAIMGLVCFAEYIDGIAVVSMKGSKTIGAVTATSEAVAEDTEHTKLTITAVDGAEGYRVATGSVTVAYGDDASAYAVVGEDGLAEATNGATLTVIAVNGTGQAIASGTVVAVVTQ